MADEINIHWFRRDLRLDENTALYHALKSKNKVQPIFIFDSDILDKIEDKNDRRVSFIYGTIVRLKATLEKTGNTLWVFYGRPEEIWKEIIAKYNVGEVFVNHDYEPYGTTRDRKIEVMLQQKNIAFHSFKDIVLFEKNEIVKDDDSPYTIFTPYSKKWKTKLEESGIKSYLSEDFSGNFHRTKRAPMPLLEEIGFQKNMSAIPTESIDENIISNYDKTRDYPALKGVSRLGLFLRFGTISIRKLMKTAKDLNDTFLNELIWRDFYHQILFHFPYVAERSFKKKYDGIKWRNDETEYKLWCDGKTGYPIVDAGMRELNATGFMHNRVRMITAGFLCKHLLIEPRWGEHYFAEKLLDFDLAANNGGWQWAAGTGTDAAPYFRIFNPTEQSKKFDPENEYIKKWVPEFETADYSEPIVEHRFARERCLQVYKSGLGF